MKLRACASVAALVAAGVLPAVTVTAPASAEEVGTVAAVNRDMTGTPPGAAARILDLGLDIVTNERVETSDVGSGQLLFLDQTTLTVAPNSDIVLDEYVYDPNAGTTDLALSVTRGALRFIGGRITKDGPAVVRTPTATVGIRGGMAVLQVDEQGVTQVIHIAGEFTSVTQFGDADGDGLDDGFAPDGAQSVVVLSRPSATALADDTGVEFTGIASSEQLAQVFGKLEGQGQGGVEAAPSDTVVEGGSQQVAAVNSGVPGGETNQPVSTSGEQAAPASGQAEQSVEAAIVTQNENPQTGGDADDAETPTGALVPAGGAIFAPNLGFKPFDSTEAGSLIGRSDEEIVTLPVPDALAELLAQHPEGAEFTPRALSINPESGLFPFDPATASSTTLGGLGGEFGNPGTGFADFGNEFVFVPFVASDLGIVMFGTPTPGQGQVFAGDPNTAGANTVDTYHNEFGLDLGRSFLFIGGGGRNPVPEELHIVGKSGQPRFTSGWPDGSGQEAEIVVAEPVGRAVSAGLDLSAGSERLALFVEPLLSSGATPAEEMQITGAGFVTLNQNGTYSFGEPAYGTFEDADGHTLFGPDANYFVLSSVHRDRDGTLDTTDFGTDQVTLSETAPGGTTTFDPPFRASLFTRDPARAEVIADPLPLAGQTSGTGQSGALDGGFAAAAVICSSGNCGDDQDPSEGFSFNGAYALLSRDPTDVQVKFDDDTAGAGFNFALHTVEEGGDPNIAFAGADPGLFVFNVPDNGVLAGDAYGAYLDDRRFAAVGTGQQVIAGNSQLGTVGLASSGLVGTPDGLFPSGTDTQPEYLRWGYWAATYQVADATAENTRTDLAPLGAFVAGNTPDPTELAEFTGSARFAGLAVGTAADLANGTTRTIGGSFSLDYDFGDSQGNLDLDLPTFLADPLSVPVTGVNGNIAYSGGIDTPDLGAVVRGGFFAGGGDPIAATAGNFGIVDNLSNAAAVGVFGGDRIAAPVGEIVVITE